MNKQHDGSGIRLAAKHSAWMHRNFAIRICKESANSRRALPFAFGGHAALSHYWVPQTIVPCERSVALRHCTCNHLP